MEELSHVNPTPCAGLERLAAAAVTMGYSTDPMLRSHPTMNSTINTTDNLSLSSTSLSATVVPQYSSNPYDLSRPQHYAAVRFYPPRPMFDQRSSFSTNVNQHQLINSTHNTIPIPRIGTNYAVVHRSDIPQNGSIRNQQFNIPNCSKQNNIAGTSGTSVHYIDARNFSTNTNGCVTNEPTIIAVSQAPSIHLANSSEIATQSVIHVGLLQHEVPIVKEVIASGSTMHEVLDKNKDKKSKKIKKSKIKSDLNEPKNNDIKINIDESPEPVLINGKKYFICNLCNEKFARKYMYKRHQIFHTGEKRGSLSLETKAEIIQRIKAGEKQVDLAMEYNVGRSTLSFIMKNSEKFLGVLKDGKFLPKSKRLRGAQREDVEEAIYEWFKQATHLGLPVSGPILCRKARDFAIKLGYPDFKATHGWLDRFKHRKQIVLGRGKTMKVKEEAEEETDEFKEDFADLILPNILIEYDSNDVFHASEIGLLYKVLPTKAPLFKGSRCAGGSHSKERLTILMCCNMTGTEKFPLLVIGKHPKPKCFKNVKSLPVQYLSSEKSWMTKDSFNAWLTDLNSWFEPQNRKVLLVVPNLPIHPRSPKLSSVRVVVSPSNFLGPSKLGITQALKRNYRRGILEYLLQLIDDLSLNKKKSKKAPLKLSLLTCLHQLAVAWHAVTDVTISNSFQRSGLGKYGLWGMNLLAETTLGTENLDLIHRLKMSCFKIPENFTFDDFVTFDDEVQVCHFMDDDDIIASITGADVESSDSEEDVCPEMEIVANKENKENPDKEYRGPPFSEVKNNLNIIRNHIFHQIKGTPDMLNVLSHLEYLLHKSANITCSTLPSVIESSEKEL